MNATEIKYEVELSNSCTCVFCKECGIVSIGIDQCDECNSPTTATRDCDGDCWQWTYEDLEENLIPEFIERNGSRPMLRIEGTGMGWQSRSGYLEVNATFKDLLEALTFSGDWTLRFYFEGDSLSVRRWSHDEPMGSARFNVIPMEADDADE